ncbi:hypothetical protein GCM10010212_22920 [Paenarthrobacter nicotinovorans]|nr:hypothetical protein GCM10010212_22920 [Paenarthrobacter nicotinovorans]
MVVVRVDEQDLYTLAAEFPSCCNACKSATDHNDLVCVLNASNILHRGSGQQRFPIRRRVFILWTGGYAVGSVLHSATHAEGWLL